MKLRWQFEKTKRAMVTQYELQNGFIKDMVVDMLKLENTLGKTAKANAVQWLGRILKRAGEYVFNLHWTVKEQ